MGAGVGEELGAGPGGGVLGAAVEGGGVRLSEREGDDVRAGSGSVVSGIALGVLVEFCVSLGSLAGATVAGPAVTGSSVVGDAVCDDDASGVMVEGMLVA